MADSHADIDRHVKIYIIVFVSLMALTVVTVAVAFLDVPTAVAVGLALIIASVKGSLVACYFMHLISEKKLILAVMVLTVVFFVALLFGPILTEQDVISQ
jgi:cytochrome c oxidase subunit 4